jgi:copper transport protein
LSFIVGFVLLGGAAFPSVAFAHASVESTSPEAGSTVSQSPREITITFDQGISVPRGAVRILNEQAERIGTEKPRVEATSGRSNTVSVGVPKLANGAYVVSWRAVSEDGHPIRGAFTFRVGASGDQTAVAKLARELLTNGRSDPGLSLAMAITRALSFAAILVLLGGSAYVLMIRPSLTGNDQRVSSLVKIGGTAAAISGFTTIAMFGPYAAGEGFRGIGDGTLLDDTLSSYTGRSLLFRTVALMVLAWVLLRRLCRLTRIPARAPGSLLATTNPQNADPTSTSATTEVESCHTPPNTLPNTPSKTQSSTQSNTQSNSTVHDRAGDSLGDTFVVICLSFTVLVLTSFIGHGATGRWRILGALATVIHVGAAATWIGLLVVMLTAFSPTKSKTNPAVNPTMNPTTNPSANTPATNAILPAIERFSTVAFWSVAALVLSGFLNGLRQTGTTRGLSSTSYGRLLLVKIGIVGVIVGLGYLSRKSLVERRTGARKYEAFSASDLQPNPLPESDIPPSKPEHVQSVPGTLAVIRRRMVLESGLGIAVLAVTSLLVNAPPPIEVIGKPVSVTMRGTTFLLDTTVSPAQSGRNRIHFYALTPEGQIQAVESMTVSAAMPTSDIAPIDLRVVRAGPNHFQALGADLPVKGAWRFTVEVQLDTFTAESLATTITIR